MKKKNVVLSLSGGMDSSTLLLRCLDEYENVTAISFDYGQKHRVELERAENLVRKYVNPQRIVANAPSYNKYNQVKYQVIELKGLTNLLESALVSGGDEVPEGHYEEDNMKATVVPNRNKIFASIIQAAALSVVAKTGEPCDIALGIHAGDHAIYPDCRQEFRDADDEAFRMGNWDADKVGYFTPYLQGDKFDILKDGERLCEKLGLDFDQVYKRTNTSYKPIPIYTSHKELHKTAEETGSFPEITFNPITVKWYSDYKSASSVERIEAFLKLGRPDPVEYADETGPVSWEVAKSHVEKLLAEHNEQKN